MPDNKCLVAGAAMHLTTAVEMLKKLNCLDVRYSRYSRGGAISVHLGELADLKKVPGEIRFKTPKKEQHSLRAYVDYQGITFLCLLSPTEARQALESEGGADGASPQEDLQPTVPGA